jgi:queuosine precursor transporter
MKHETPTSTQRDEPQGSAGVLTPAATLYAWLSAASVGCLVIANVIGVKLFQYDLGFATLEHTAGMITFPLTFLITDLINEYYGKKAARRVAIIGFVVGMLVFGVIKFATSTDMYLASMCAFLLGSLADIAIFGWIKRATGTRWVWLRATGSTVASQLLDSFVVTYLAFSLFRRIHSDQGVPMDLPQVFSTALTGYTLKFVIALALTPAIYAGRAIIQSKLGLKPMPAE